MKRHLPRFFDSSTFSQIRPFTPTLLLLGATLTLLTPASLRAQTLTFTGSSPSVNFGSVNLCKPGQAKPAPCSKTLTLDYKVTAGGTLGAPKALTMGSPNLDFTLANGTTCTGGVTVGETCSVNVRFAPRFAGAVAGAIQLMSEGGTVLATTPILGTGTGPQIGTLTNAVITYFEPVNWVAGMSPSQVAVDGAGDLIGIVPSTSDGPLIVEQLAGAHAQITLPFKFDSSLPPTLEAELVLDGAGDLFFPASNHDQRGVIAEFPSGGSPEVTLPFSLFDNPDSLSVLVDGIGDSFAFSNNNLVLKLPAGCQSSSCEETLVTTRGIVAGVSADTPGDVFVAQYYGAGPITLTEFPVGGGSPIVLPYIAGPGVIDGVGDMFTFVDDTASVSADSLNLVEIPAGSSTPVVLIGNLDGYDCGPYQLAVDLPGNVYFTYGCPNRYVEEPYQATTGEVQRSQFAPLNFGSLAVGAAKTLSLGVTNTGNANLIVSPYLESPSYKILSQNPAYCLGGTLPGRTCNLNIQFTALSEGPHTITLTLGSNGANDSTVLLEGNGTK